jgi:glycine/D-amino acid oxidase-like deaminating enzyme
VRIFESDIAVIGPEAEARVIAQIIRLQANLRVNIAVTADASAAETSPHWFGYPGHFDNFTRLAAAHGRKFAEEIWQMSAFGLELTQDFLASMGVRQNSLQKLRLIRSAHELAEARQAVEWMRGLKHAEYVEELTPDSDKGERFWRVENLQKSAANAGLWCSAGEVMDALRQCQGELCRLETSIQSKTTSNVVEITDGKSTVRSEIIVLVGRSETVALFPELDDVLVEFTERWIEFDRPRQLKEFDQLIIANHGNIWGAAVSDRMMLGGARYLQDLTESKAKGSHGFVEHMTRIASQLSESLDELANLKSCRRAACYPCDELPIVGPYHSNHRLILIQGLWGWGINMLVAAGYGTADLIMGKNSNLPRRLWPERLRSL